MIVAGVTFAILAASAAAHIAPDPIGEGSGTAPAHAYASVNKRAQTGDLKRTASLDACDIWTTNCLVDRAR
jgi:hypothetical protein